MRMTSQCAHCGADLRVCKDCDWYNGVWIPKDQYEARLKADMADILDKIRAEIEGLTYYWCEVNPKSVIDDVLQIIDKYKSESET